MPEDDRAAATPTREKRATSPLLLPVRMRASGLGHRPKAARRWRAQPQASVHTAEGPRGGATTFSSVAASLLHSREKKGRRRERTGGRGGGAGWDLLRRRHPFTVGDGRHGSWPRAHVCGAERNGQRQNVFRVRGRSNDYWFCSA
jgi:hypothetical protein